LVKINILKLYFAIIKQGGKLTSIKFLLVFMKPNISTYDWFRADGSHILNKRSDWIISTWADAWMRFIKCLCTSSQPLLHTSNHLTTFYPKPPQNAPMCLTL